MHGTLKGSDRQDRFFWNQKSQYSVNSKKKKRGRQKEKEPVRKAMLRVIHPCVSVSVFWWRKRHTGVASQFQGYSYTSTYTYTYI